jgi:Raf kinase inhibitor-like YbhB/YbcL family protein
MKKYSLCLFLILIMFEYPIFATNFTLESAAFELNSMIPAEYSCHGKNISPPLNWQNSPSKTKSFTLIVEDPDAPAGVWTHWIVFNIPPIITHLKEGDSPPHGSASGKNSWSKTNYQGPCPSIGVHRYLFKLYALDKILDLGEGASTNTILDAMTGHVVGMSELVGLYQNE